MLNGFSVARDLYECLFLRVTLVVCFINFKFEVQLFMLKIEVNLRIIIHADDEQTADGIVEAIAKNIDIKDTTSIKLSGYEDDFHFETSLTREISGDSCGILEYNLFKISTTIEKGPWLFYNLPTNCESLEGFEFEAFFNPEAFIHNDPSFRNKLKWAHLEVVTT